MAKITEMTQLSPTMTEGTIVNWIKKEGEEVSPGDIIAEVETDKAVMEMEAYDSGFLLKILAENGSKVKVGLPIAILGSKEENIESLISESREKLKSGQGAEESRPQSEHSENKNPSGSGSQPKAKSDSRPEQSEKISSSTPSDTSAPKEKESNQASPKKETDFSPSPNPSGRIFASPLARHLAKQTGVSLSQVTGSGPGGRILERDIQAFLRNQEFGYPDLSREKSSTKLSMQNNQKLDSGKAETDSGEKLAKFFGQSQSDQKIPVSNMRKVIAERLQSSKQNLPHFYLNMEVDAGPMVEYRQKLNQGMEAITGSNWKISLNDLIVKATAMALRSHPAINASWAGDHILQKKDIDIGIAVALPDGLITPILRKADYLGVGELSQKIRELAGRAKSRKLKPEEFTGSSFTISNLGMYGVQFFTAIINEPESAILAVGSVMEKPVVQDGEIKIGHRMEITLSCDHRVIDGAIGASFLGTLRTFLETPELLSI
jgi:pyruvate dehydrogenase E2 component (dihydrolipoamide acetyltransferase)